MTNYIIDDRYNCWLCNKSLIYDAYQKIVVETETKKEHHCDRATTVRNTNFNSDFSQQIAEEEARRYESWFYQSRDIENQKAAQELQKYNEAIDVNEKRHALEDADNNGKSWPKTKRERSIL